MSLKIRRGTNSERLTIVPDEGELIYTTDTKKVYVGDGTTTGGNVASNAFQGTINDDILFSTHNINGTNISINGTSGAITANIVKSNIVDDDGNIILNNLSYQNQLNLYTYNPSGVSINNGVGDPASIRFYNLLPHLGSNRHYTSRGTWNSPTTVLNNDTLFANFFNGHNGSAFTRSVGIYAIADGTVVNNKVPGRYVIQLVNNTGTADIYAAFNSYGVFSAPSFRTGSYTTSPDNRPSGTGLLAGTIIFETTTNTFQGWNGTTWVTLG